MSIRDNALYEEHASPSDSIIYDFHWCMDNPLFEDDFVLNEFELSSLEEGSFIQYDTATCG